MNQNFNIDKEKVWNETLESIKVSVSGAIFSTWFTQTHLLNISENKNRYTAEVGCTSSFVKTTIEGRYFGMIQDTLQNSLGAPCDLVFTIKQKGSVEKEEVKAPLFDSFNGKNVEIDQFKVTKAGIRPSFTFDNFAVSSSNQMAWAATEAVAKSPGTAYNPLFIWGGVGVGKTHLMHAVGHSLLKNNPDASIVVATGEQFTNDIVEGIRNKSTQTVRKKYRKLTALFVDDIQFIAGKDAVQEEFFHTFNTLVNSGSQIILTSDRPPSEISKLEERLRSRFEAGLIVDISPPDFELRCAITQIKSQERGLELDMECVQLIAANIDSARKIEGFLVKLMSEATLKKIEINTSMIESFFGKGEMASISKGAGPNEVILAVSKYYSVGKRSLLGKSRARQIAQPRQVLMYLLRTQLSLPLQEVGRLIGGRDHTTVMHAVEKITHLATDNVQIREDIRGIKNMI